MANFCPQCGARLAPTSKFCPQCGVRIASDSPQEETSAQIDVSTIQAEEKVPTAPADPPKEETTSPHFTISQPAQTPKTAENYLTMLKNDLTIEGRLNRKRYWVRTGLCIVPNIIAAIFMEIPAELPIFFGAILTIAVSIYQIMFTVRRAHDLGRSGWYLLWGIVPLVNIYIAIRISFIEGEKGPNRFGPDPLETPGTW
ncbi:MAG: DUF805 domain-containing protein [Acidaminococcus sp.]|uniref:DUF805 domain-containing protein n=1 Tax=Acidaminococcus sp. TaxID=1872103 RepID=UPI002A74EFEE|nr:DUF805 domain-containing protein [Acidaminococcus sp.]MDY2739138.1 DUF805 domain-containing protein [Acidaminococcus sp.]